jgi:hypothetical protein
MMKETGQPRYYRSVGRWIGSSRSDPWIQWTWERNLLLSAGVGTDTYEGGGATSTRGQVLSHKGHVSKRSARGVFAPLKRNDPGQSTSQEAPVRHESRRPYARSILGLVRGALTTAVVEGGNMLAMPERFLEGAAP